jgi:glucose/mannose-6-phosphate isomerase
VTHPQYLDTLGVWDATVGLPEQLRAAAATAEAVLEDTVLPRPGDIRSVVVFGMGSGATAAEAVAAYGTGRASVPVWVGNGYESPAFVGPHTLAFAVSASGDTEETIAAASAARARGAHLVVVSGVGALAAMAAASDLPLFEVPAGPAPRTALGALAVPVLLTLSRAGILPDAAAELEGVATPLSRRRDALVGPGGPAERVARLIGRTIPLVYGSEGLTAVAARRWKTQINENAKAPAWWSAQPELSHNEICGWGQNGDVTRQLITVVALRHDAEHPQVGRRFELVAEMMREVVADVIEIRAEGDGDLAQLFDLILIGDFVSLWLSAQSGVDPGPVPALDELKQALSGP